jgi:Mn-containing catalase
MNRDFEFSQLLRAYRRGIISESTFEREMAELERGTGVDGGGFTANGKSYPSERAAVIDFVDNLRANEFCAGLAFPKWAAVCKTDCIRSGLAMIAERESYHARVFEQRLKELGAEKRAVEVEEVRKFHDYFGDANISDGDKLLRVTALFPNPKETVGFIGEFADQLKDDHQTKEMLKLFQQDELSSTTWLMESCAAINGLNKGAQTSAAAMRQ